MEIKSLEKSENIIPIGEITPQNSVTRLGLMGTPSKSYSTVSTPEPPPDSSAGDYKNMTLMGVG